jgi:hypothetical protein
MMAEITKCPNCGGPIEKEDNCLSCKDKECGWGVCT